MNGTNSVASPAGVVEDVYRAFENKDPEALFACFADDVVICQSEQLPWGGTYRGLEEATGFFASLMAHIATRVSVDRFIVAGDTVVEVGRTEGEALASGRTFAIDEVHVFRVRDGKIARMEAYVDNAAMLEALSSG